MLEENERKASMQFDVASRLLDDANTRLKEMIDASDMVGIKIAR